MKYDIVGTLEDIMQAMKIRKIDEGLDGDKRRRWAIAYTDTEKLYAFVKTFLVESEEESEN